MKSCRSPAWLLCFFAPYPKKQLQKSSSIHAQTHGKSSYMHVTMFTLRQRVCVCVCVRGPSDLLLALRLKQCQQVCDETSQTIPHLSLFSILALLVSLSHCLSNPLFSHLFLSLVHYFLSLSISLVCLIHTPCGQFYVFLLPLPPISIYTSITLYVFSPSLFFCLFLDPPLSLSLSFLLISAQSF